MALIRKVIILCIRNLDTLNDDKIRVEMCGRITFNFFLNKEIVTIFDDRSSGTFFFSDQQPHAWSKALPLGQTNGRLLCHCGGKSCAYCQYIHAGTEVLFTLNLF